MLVEFEVYEHELSTTHKVKAQGFLEAIAEVLPWPSIEVEIHWKPNLGMAEVVDKTTDFKYTVKKI
jgi:hypothetical protein